MIKKISYLAYAANYYFRTQILGNNLPFIGGLVINEKCNLYCKHCNVSNRKIIPDLSFTDIKTGLQTFYKKGIRNVFIEGGEPFLWKDGDRQVEDIIKLAREIGFHLVSIYTNGTLPINCTTDSVFVSLDGLKNTTNRLRGNGNNIYDKIIQNIELSSHPNIIINFTINNENKNEIADFCKEIKEIKKIQGIFFYFHTPYYGVDELFIDFKEKRKIILEIIQLKKKGYKIFNSLACLKSIYTDKWKRPSKLCYVFANNQLYECCRANGTKIACENCGYLGYAEIIHILKLRPSSIISALNYLPQNQKQ